MNNTVIEIMGDKKKLNEHVHRAYQIMELLDKQVTVSDFDQTHCCLCGDKLVEFGCNPEPVMSILHKCCSACNEKIVIPLRFTVGGNRKNFMLFPDDERALQDLISLEEDSPNS